MLRVNNQTLRIKNKYNFLLFQTNCSALLNSNGRGNPDMEPFCNHFDQFGFEFDVLQYSGVDLVRFLSRTGAHNSD